MACSVLMACNLEQFFGTENTVEVPGATTKISESTSSVPQKVPKEEILTPNFAHGDNLTNEDIYFIMEHAGNEVPICDYPTHVPNDLSGFLNYMKARNFTYYEISVDFDAPYYYICAYIDRSWFDNIPLNPPGSAEAGYPAQYYVWYKFEHNEDIPEEIDNYVFRGGFVLFDCLIEKDILNNKEHNYECKFFVSLRNGYSDIGTDFASMYKGYNNSILYYYDFDFLFDGESSSNKYLFFAPLYYQLYHRIERWERVVDNDGQKYITLFLSSEKYDPDVFTFEVCRDDIGDLYDQLLPYLIVKEENIGYRVCISLDNLAKVWDLLP